jgi:flavin-dependent dehydrogenase
MNYDVVIAGASFSGLTLAHHHKIVAIGVVGTEGGQLEYLTFKL